jgi:putative CRISPR-associated protein (TIGR02620 family)
VVTGPEYVVITRHQALILYLFEQGIVPLDTPVISHGTADDVQGKVVVGPLPLHLAALAESIVHIPLDIPSSMRGVELSIEQVRQYAKPPESYVVKRS